MDAAAQTPGEDARWMSHAVRLAERGLYGADPNPRVGCVLVRDGAVVGEGWHGRAGGPHAEVEALRAAGEAARGASAYVTLEPCCHHGLTPPCADALLAAGVSRVVAAMTDPNPLVAGQGLARLRTAGVPVTEGVLAADAEALNPGFLRRMRGGRPWVRGKLAMSLDGRTAMASGESQWITGPAARRDVQRWRARSSAILTGIGTVLADDPALTVRESALPAGDLNVPVVRQPWRVVLDPELETPLDARLLSQPGQTLLLTTRAGVSRRRALEAAGAEVAVLPDAPGGLDLAAVLAYLGERSCNEIWLECGPTLAGAMLRAGLVDEWLIYVAPKILGSAARGLFDLPGLDRLADGIPLAVSDMRAVGPDWRIRLRPADRDGG